MISKLLVTILISVHPRMSSVGIYGIPSAVSCSESLRRPYLQFRSQLLRPTVWKRERSLHHFRAWIYVPDRRSIRLLLGALDNHHDSNRNQCSYIFSNLLFLQSPESCRKKESCSCLCSYKGRNYRKWILSVYYWYLLKINDLYYTSSHNECSKYKIIKDQ